MYEHDIETCLHDHNHEGHTSDEEQAFPPYEENLFISLAKQARAGLLETPPDVSVEEIEELARRYRIDDILERLGEREPPLKFGHYASTVLAFASGYHQLPPPPTRYEHDEHHHDVHNDSHDCGKIHGPVRRWLDRLESEMLSRIPNRRVQAMAAIALRLCSLSICPGDDIAAVGMQVYSAASGSSHEGERPEGKEEEKAVLPRRPRIDFEANKAYLPLDVVVSHEELPNTKFGDELRDITNDNGPKQNDATTERLKKEAALKPEKLRRRQRIMAFGAIALTALGVVLGGSVQSTKTDTAPARNNTAPVPQPDIRPDHQNILNRPVIMERVTVSNGDSQWKMVEKRAGSRNNAVLNAITAYTAYLNTGSHPNADLLESGEQILMPPQEVTSKIEAAVTNPESTDPVLVKYIVTLNNQSSYTSEEARKVLKLINSYFV